MNKPNTYLQDSFCLESFSYLSEAEPKEIDKSIDGKPVSDEVIENSKRKGIIGRIGGIGADSNTPTRNDRRYPLELWQNVKKSEYFIEGMQNRSIIGEADHPQERLDYSVKEGAVILTDYEIQDDGTVYTEFDILDTISGRTVKTYFDAGCKLGVSSRGLGEEIMRNGEKIIDPDTYQFYCFDVVAFPAVKSARMELIESTSPKRQNLINSITSEIKNCKSVDEVKLIESITLDADMMLDEIKETIEMKKEELKEITEKDNKNNISSRAYINSLIKSMEAKIKEYDSLEDSITSEESKNKNMLKNIINTIKDLNWTGIDSILKESNIVDLLNQLKESESKHYTGTWDEIKKALKADGYTIDAAYNRPPQNDEKIFMYKNGSSEKDGETYITLVNKYSDGKFEILFDTIKPATLDESNKIKISGENSESDEDTPDKENDSDLIILAELEEQVNSLRSENEQLKKALEQKTNVIKNLLSTNHSQEITITEQMNISKNLISHKRKSESLSRDNIKLQSTNETLQSELNSLSSKYKKLQAANKEFSNMLEGLNEKYLNEVDAKQAIREKLAQLETNARMLKSKNVKLRESLTESANRNSQLEQLNETIATLKSENSELKNKLSKSTDELVKKKESISTLNSENSKLNKQVVDSLEKYIEMTCAKYDLHKPTLKRLLGETYTFADVDKIAKELIETNAKINSLPYAHVKPERRIVAENIGLVNYSTDTTEADLENFQFMLESKNN